MLNSGFAHKSFFFGTHRLIEPHATFDRVKPFFSDFGITRVANLSGLDRIGLPVVMVCRPNARSSAVFHGKGIDLPSAKASGVMEAIETWHAEHAELPLRFGSFDELRARFQLCDVDGLPALPNVMFDRSRPLLWAEGRNLVTDRPIWVPFELVHAISTVSGPPSSNCFAAGTNGLASGNHILEAMSHALCEVIERDATSLWRCGRATEQDGRRLDLSSVDDSACRTVIECLDAARFDIGVFDITTDVGVAAFQCLIVDRVEELGHIGTGAGCHPSREIALLRALTEAAQVRMTYILGSREDITAADYATETLRGRNIATGDMIQRSAPTRSFTGVPTRSFEDFNTEVQWLVGRLEAIGLGQVIAVDLTKDELAIPVVRVLVPGLEGSDHHPFYTQGARARAKARDRR
ncbi:ribosomal protein S12 methylthiotransferase accessory factor [Rhizobiales bacterium GAS188]|nr:ribosomal protein S12 methylthiotransferase accessory factor [Rhizobiales bacterium GAS188]